MMSKQHNQPFKKKHAYDRKEIDDNNQFHLYSTPNKYHTIESKHTMEPDISNAHFSIQSSRIADETEQIQNKVINYEHVLRRKLENFEAQTCQILQKKERENYFLSVELQNYEVRLQESEQINLNQKDEIARLRNEIQKLLTQNNQLNQNNGYLESSLNKMSIEYSKLKESFQMLNKHKNESLKNTQQSEYMSIQSNYNVHYLKKQVQDLRSMVGEMEQNIKNCPSCFSLRRDNEELNQAYGNLKKIYNELNHKKLKDEKDLLQNITVKIQENQNIIRENIELKEKRAYSNSLKMGRQKFKQSVAKRCRTLTDQF